MRWGLRTQTFLRIIAATLIASSLFPRIAVAENEGAKYVFPFAKVAVEYPNDHLHYPAVDVEGCYARILAPTAGIISQLHRLDKWTPENDSPGTRGGLTITVQGDDGVRYFFSHLGRIKVLKNQRVAAGDWIGVMGSSGNARVTRCHTHMGISRVCPLAEVYLLQGEIWPQQYLNAWKKGQQLSPRKEILKLEKDDPLGCSRSRADSAIDGQRSSG
jgi:murein DD-endopeptidase MepM/ murein hydrolase activator NlpD